jgi:hypothetical protein
MRENSIYNLKTILRGEAKAQNVSPNVRAGAKAGVESIQPTRFPSIAAQPTTRALFGIEARIRPVEGGFTPDPPRGISISIWVAT